MKQDEYLRAAQRAWLSNLLKGLLEIFRATNSKRKYFGLLEHLEVMGLLRIPLRFREILTRTNLQGANEASRAIEITSEVSECVLLYVQPNGTGPDVISFAEFAAMVQQHDDVFSQRFAKSLKRWASIQAGENHLIK